MKALRFIPLVLVFLSIAVYSVTYAYGPAPRPYVTWPALNEYLNVQLRQSQLRLECDVNTLKCTLRWQPGTLGSKPINVYECDVMTPSLRSQVIAEAFAAVQKLSGDEEARAVAATVDGFFQSGLRRMCDRAVRRARDRASFAPTLTPFELEDAPSPLAEQRVKAVDTAFTTVPSGLARRPAYRGDFLANVGWATASASGVPTVLRITTPDRRVTTNVLDPQRARPCSIWPGGPNDEDCNHAQVHACDPQASGDCKSPVAELYVLSTGGVVLRAARSPAASMLGPGLSSMLEDELLSVSGAIDGISRVYIVGSRHSPGFFLEVIAGGRVPVSRLRLVNGRWQRWTERSIRPWLDPAIADYDALATNAVVNANAPVNLALNLGLQRELEGDLHPWMQNKAEALVTADLRRHFTSKARSMAPLSSEKEHRRAVPQAGITVLDPTNGAITAVASYPPASALEFVDGEPIFAPGWQRRLVGPGAPPWVIREVLDALDDRINGDTNANFAVHPVGSSFKPLLLSLFMDRQLPTGTVDNLEHLFDLVVAGHTGRDGRAIGGDPDLPVTCGGTTGGLCTRREAEAIVGLPLGPWGSEEPTKEHRPAVWVDRREFLVGSCNKYAVTLGMLSLLDWQARDNADACCWNANARSVWLS